MSGLRVIFLGGNICDLNWRGGNGSRRDGNGLNRASVAIREILDNS